MNNGHTLRCARRTKIQRGKIVSGKNLYTVLGRLSAETLDRASLSFIVFLNKSKTQANKYVPNERFRVSHNSGSKE